jgi:hypothetical protein
MNMNMKRITVAIVASCMLNTVMPTICREQKVQQQKSWSRWATIGATTLVVASICAWLYLDARIHNELKIGVTNSQKQFIEDLKHYSVYNTDGTPRIITAATSYNNVSDTEFREHTIESLNPLYASFRAELLFYLVSSKLCALATALGLYSLAHTGEKKPFTDIT